jgi:hypothetical protein
LWRFATYNTPEFADLVKKRCVAVTLDKRRVEKADDAEGRFIRQVFEKTGVEHSSNETALVTASGKYLGFGNSEYVKSLKEALEVWDNLPQAERRPGAFKVPELGRRDPKLAWMEPPPGGLSLKVFTRNLKRDASGKLVKGDHIYPHKWASKGYDAARNSLWLTRAEWQSLVPADPKRGDRFPVPEPIRQRLFRFYLTEIYRDDGSVWPKECVRSGDVALSVTDVTDAQLRLELRGNAVIASEPDIGKSKRGYKGNLYGHLVYDRKRRAFTRFDVLALGDNWWEEVNPHFMPKERVVGDFQKLLTHPITVGVSFELVPADSGFAHAPPGGTYEWTAPDSLDDYWGTGGKKK